MDSTEEIQPIDKYNATFFPAFITELLHNIGTHVDPIILIEQIQEKMEIPGLRDSLVKILQDYNLQVSCVIRTDFFSLFHRDEKIKFIHSEIINLGICMQHSISATLSFGTELGKIWLYYICIYHIF